MAQKIIDTNKAYTQLVLDYNVSLTGNYPNIYFHYTYSFKIKLTAWGNCSSTGDFWFHTNHHSANVNFNFSGANTTGVLASGSIDIKFVDGTDRYCAHAPGFGCTVNGFCSAGSTVTDRLGVESPSITASVKSKTSNSVTFNISLTNPRSFYYVKIYDQNGNCYLDGASDGSTITGLSPNTSYSFNVEAWNKNGKGKASEARNTVNVTTDKPAAPSGGSVSVSSKTYNSITISWSGFSAGAGGSISKYAYKNGNGSWSYTTGTSATFSSLSPNTSYTLYVCAIDNYGTWSGVKGVTTTTNKPNAPTAGKVTVNNITPFGATFSWSGFAFGAGAGWGKYQYGWQDTGWYDCGQSTSITLSNRSPNTSNTFYVRLVDNYGTASSNVTVTFTTFKPNAPTAGKCSVSNIACYSATVSWSGFSFGSGATWGKYQYKLGNGSWTDYSQNTTINLSSLSANTSYTCYARLVDNYGTASNAASVTFTTKSEYSWKYGSQYLKVSGSWKYGIVYYKENGKWKKITGTYYK